MDRNGKEGNHKGDLFISITIFIVVILTALFAMIVIVVYTGTPTNDEGHHSDGEIIILGIIDGNNDHLRFKQTSGEITWWQYRVIVGMDGNITDLETRTAVSYGGDTIFFTAPKFQPEEGVEYNIRIVHIRDNRIVWEDNIIAE